VNLIGEHTDYNGGFVLPMAIDADLVIAARPRDDSVVHVVSESQAEAASFTLSAFDRGVGWAEYVKGVAAELGNEPLVGWNGAIASDLTDGAGLSSSAAIELATARVFGDLAGLAWDPAAMALAGQRAENDWVGMNSGVMDQLICATGRAGHARLIDCRDLSGTDVPLIDGTAVVLLDTGTRRTLVDSEYNARRSDCENAARALGVEFLRDATLEMVTDAGLEERLARRARHVVGENRRTVAAASALEAGDATTLGALMNESHASLRDDFEVSSPALDAMARIARSMPGCFGARQTGGGFAGSCVALVDASVVAAFGDEVTAGYQTETGKTGSATTVKAVDGVEASWMT
jgi:galactokinase